MPISRDELDQQLAQFLDIGAFSDFCPNGLQVEGKSSIHKIAFAVSADLQTIEKAIACQADALIVHHGLFWNKDPYPICGTKKKKVEKLLAHQLSVFAYHLPLDAHTAVGNNWAAAADLGLQNLEPFEEIGVLGNVPAIAIDAFVRQLEDYYHHPAITALGGKKMISKVALVSGGAYKLLSAAAKQKIDCFITGNFDEPAWHIAHEENIHFIALGHSATERIGIKKLATWIADTFQIETLYLEDNNPF